MKRASSVSYSFPVTLVHALAKVFVAALEIANYVGDGLAVGQCAARESPKRNPDVLKVQLRALEHPPIQEGGRQVGQRTVTPGASEHQHLGSDGRDGEAADAFLPEDGPGAFGGVRKSAFGTLPLDAGFGRDREPSVDEFVPFHSQSVVPKHEQPVTPVVVHFHPLGVRVVRVLEQLTDRGRDAGDLLPPQHVQRPGPGLEGYFHRRQMTSASARCRATWWPTTVVSLTGTALPICRALEVGLPEKRKSIGNVCRQAASRTLIARSCSG